MEKNSVDVIINGKVYILSGGERTDYMQKVAAYINGRIQDLKRQQGYLKQSADMQNVMIQLNIADDYFKLKDEFMALQKQCEQMEKELYALKHENVSLKMKMDEAE